MRSILPYPLGVLRFRRHIMAEWFSSDHSSMPGFRRRGACLILSGRISPGVLDRPHRQGAFPLLRFSVGGAFSCLCLRPTSIGRMLWKTSKGNSRLVAKLSGKFCEELSVARIDDQLMSHSLFAPPCLFEVWRVESWRSPRPLPCNTAEAME